MAKDLLALPVRDALVVMAAPAAVGMLLTFLFQLVDTYFLGQLGSQALAAVSFAYPVYFLVVSFFMGIASGVSSTVGKALGEKDPHKASALTTISLALFMFVTLAIGVAGYFSISPVFSLLGVSQSTLPLVSDYMQILYLGMFSLVGALIGNAALMAKGIMLKPTVIMGIGGVINLVLDYVLIFGMGPIPAMEMKGAAWATVISWGAILVLMIGLLAKERLIAFAAIGPLSKVMHGTREILSIGMPAVTAQILNPIAIAVATRVVSQFGENAVAAYGIATRVETLGLTGILALSVILTPVVAQNFGAEKQQRLDQVIAYSGRMTVYWGILLYALLLIFAEPIASILTHDQEVIQHTKIYLYIVGLSLPAFGLTLITASFFNGVYQPKSSLKLTLVKYLGLTIPLAVLGSLVAVEAIWVALALANLAGAIYAGRLLERWLVGNNSLLAGHNPLMDYVDDFRIVLAKLTGK